MNGKKNLVLILATLALLAAAITVSLYQFEQSASADAPTVLTNVEPALTPPENAPVLMVVGDSLSAGYGLSSLAESWVALMQDRLLRKGYGIRVVNASISGDTSGGGAARLPAALDRHQPSIVIIELGGNDGLRGLSLDVMRENFELMIDAARAIDAAPILLGMLIPPNYGQRYTDQFEAQFVELSEQYNIPLVPFFLEDVALRDDLMQSDGIHPNAAAQPYMLDRVWPAVEMTVRQTLKMTRSEQE
ncbi:MAG: arylesterase [Pseudomonadota bacterium]